MPPRKKPVLFEVVARSQRARKRRSGTSPSSPWPQIGTTPPSTGTTPSTAPEPPAHTATVQRTERRVHLALGWPHFVITAAVAVVSLVAAFQAGRQSMMPPDNDGNSLQEILAGSVEQPTASGDKPAVTPAGDVARPVQTPTPRQSPSRGAQTPPTAPPQPRATLVELEEGKHYVVAQYFPQRARRAADAARDYLASHGVPAIVKAGRGDWMVVVAQPFESEGAARDLIKRVKDIGSDYARTGSGYDFGGAMARKF